MEDRIRPGMMRYCVVGNIVKSHIDEKGILRYGTKVFSGGRKVYLTRLLYEDGVMVMGKNRFMSRYEYEVVPYELIENIRSTRVFQPSIIKKMADIDFWEMPLNTWWSYKDEDRASTEEYLRIYGLVKAGDMETLDEYQRKVRYGKYGGW